MNLRNRRSAAAAIAAMAIALGTTGCGGDDAAGDSARDDQGAALAVAERTAEMYAQQDAAGICANMTDAVRAERAAEAKQVAKLFDSRLPGGRATCEAGLDLAFANAVQRSSRMRIAAVTVKGRSAYVRGGAAQGDNDHIATLAKEKGAWKVVDWFGQSSVTTDGAPRQATGDR